MKLKRILVLIALTRAVLLAQSIDGGCQGHLEILGKLLKSHAPVLQDLINNPYADLGSYKGRPVTTDWLPDGRNMRTKSDLTYTDPCGTVWDAPAGTITDGASIPKWAWSIIGGPYEGRFRDAAVIHDAACDRRDRPWQAVHEAFYFAMLAAGGLYDTWQTKVMFAAVYHFGPRWQDPKSLINESTPRLTRSQFNKLAGEIKKGESTNIYDESSTLNKTRAKYFIRPLNLYDLETGKAREYKKGVEYRNSQ